MTIMQQGVTGTDQEDKAEQMPFQLLGKHETGIEQLAHDDIGKNHQYQAQGYPGRTAADPFINIVDNATQPFNCIHEFNPYLTDAENLFK